MIITLKGADFSAAGKHIGTLDTWRIDIIENEGFTHNGATTVKRDDPYSVTATIKSDFELDGSVIVTMGGNPVTSGITVNGQTVTISIGSVTGNVVIKVPTKNAVTGEEDGGNDDNEQPEVVTGTLFLQNGALSVVKGENFYVSLGSETSKTKRMNSSSATEPTGIWVPADGTITLTGTSGLRFDYVYATKAGPNSTTDSTSNVIGGVGTASNFVSSNYFPLNADGSSNTITITNEYGQGYYYHFAIAGVTKTETLNPSDYNITYVVYTN